MTDDFLHESTRRRRLLKSSLSIPEIFLSATTLIIGSRIIANILKMRKWSQLDRRKVLGATVRQPTHQTSAATLARISTSTKSLLIIYVLHEVLQPSPEINSLK